MVGQRQKLCGFILLLFFLSFGLSSVGRADDEVIKEYNSRSQGGGVNFEASIVVQQYKDLFILWDLHLTYEAVEFSSAESLEIKRSFKDIDYIRRAKMDKNLTEIIKENPELAQALSRIEVVFKDGYVLNIDQDFLGLSFEYPGADGGTEGFLFDKFVPSADLYTFFELFPSKLHTHVYVLGLGEAFYHSYALNMPSLYDRIYQAFHERSVSNPLGSKLSPLCQELLVIEGGKKD